MLVEVGVYEAEAPLVSVSHLILNFKPGNNCWGEKVGSGRFKMLNKIAISYQVPSLLFILSSARKVWYLISDKKQMDFKSRNTFSLCWGNTNTQKGNNSGPHIIKTIFNLRFQLLHNICGLMGRRRGGEQRESTELGQSGRFFKLKMDKLYREQSKHVSSVSRWSKLMTKKVTFSFKHKQNSHKGFSKWYL